ncbi:MAG: DUF2608 domain-containing protein [Holosporales bacterium]|jgi:hypothetical protein|nr:DUF2608 domain-containing protein [Holosporales bacterium]
MFRLLFSIVFFCCANLLAAMQQPSQPPLERPLVIKSRTIQTSDVGLIAREIRGLDSRTTIVFVDCDAVVFEHLIDGALPERFLHSLSSELAGEQIPEGKRVNAIAEFLKAPKRQVCPELNRLLKELRDAGAVIIFLTSCPAGRFGQIQSIAELRKEDLTSCGIPPQDWGGITILFNELEETPRPSVVQTDDTASVFKNGICFNIISSKGKVMTAFLNRLREDSTFERLLGAAPSNPFAINLSGVRSLLRGGRQSELTTFFIDDSPGNIENVAAACQEYGVNYLGIQFTAQMEAYRRIIMTKEIAAQFLFVAQAHLPEELIWGDTSGEQLRILIEKGIFQSPRDVRFRQMLCSPRLLYASLFV